MNAWLNRAVRSVERDPPVAAPKTRCGWISKQIISVKLHWFYSLCTTAVRFINFNFFKPSLCSKNALQIVWSWPSVHHICRVFVCVWEVGCKGTESSCEKKTEKKQKNKNKQLQNNNNNNNHNHNNNFILQNRVKHYTVCNSMFYKIRITISTMWVNTHTHTHTHTHTKFGILYIYALMMV